MRTPSIPARAGPIDTSSPTGSLRQNTSNIWAQDTAQPSSDAFLKYCTEDTPAFLSKAGSHSDLSTLSLLAEDEALENNDGERDTANRDFSDDSSNLNGNNGNIMAECMPKNIPSDYQEPRCVPFRPKPKTRPGPSRGVQSAVPTYLVPQDELETYAIEDSPFQHSLSSSLSDLRVDGGTKVQHRKNLTAASQKQTDEKERETGWREESSPHVSPSGSLSSVDFGSDDGRILDMAIEAGMPKHKDGSSYVSGRRSQTSSILDQRKSQDSCTLEEKSEEHVTILTRHDSLSSLSVDSLGSNEEEQALFKQCVKSGMPKNRSDVHSKTLDRVYKNRTTDSPKKHIRSHRSLERNKDGTKIKQTERDPEFEALVASGAFKNCSQKFSKTEQDIIDRTLLENAIFIGMPKRKGKTSVPYSDAIVPDTLMHYQEDFINKPSASQTAKETLSKSDLKSTNLSKHDDGDREAISSPNASPAGSLSSVEFGSDDGRLLDMAIQAGMPKQKGGSRDSQKSHVRSHRSLDRSKDSGGMKPLDRDPEFEALVASGAFKNCSQKFSKTEQDIIDRALLENAIYCGMPKRRDKVTSPYGDAIVPDSSMQYREYNEKQPKRMISKSDGSKNVQATSVAAESSQSCSLTSTGAALAASDVKMAVRVGDTARIPSGGHHTLTAAPLSITKHQRITLPQMDSDQSDKKRLLSGDAFGDSPFNLMSAGSELRTDEIDGNKLPKSAPEIDTFFNESVLDQSNEFQAINSSSFLEDTLESNINHSNESCANLLNESQTDLDNSNIVETNYDIPNLKKEYPDISDTKALMQSCTLSSSLKYEVDAEREPTLDSNTDKHTSSGKEKISEKHNSTDTWNENTCPNDISFPTISGSLPMLTSFKSDLGDETTCNVLPDLLEESLIISDGPNQPDVTNPKMSNDLETFQLCAELENVSIGDVYKHQNKITPHDDQTIAMNDFKPIKINPNCNEHEADILSRTIRESSYDFSSCLTESGLSMNSLDLDNVKPPSHMGSLLSLSHSLSGNWEDSLDKDRVHSKRSVSKIHRKKSLPIGLMIKRALGYSHSNQGSSENLDCAVSNLENVKPPSEMDDVFDMENSMISVASIVSEVADTQDDDDASTIIFDFKQPVTGSHLMSHLSIGGLDIENINPPSLFDELTESTLENDDNDESCLTNTLAHCPDIPSGSESGTPVQSDFGSSAESTPKKSKSANKKYLTPKQKRQLTRDRYKTYTIAAEMAIKEEDLRNKIPESLASTEPVEFPNLNFDGLASPRADDKDRRSRSNPKQRRQEDRARYQTQTVNIANLNFTHTPPENIKNAVKDPEIEELKRRLEAKKSIKQKRLDNADRYRTRTLEESVILSPGSSSLSQSEASQRMSVSPSVSSSATTQIQTFEYNQHKSMDESSVVDLDCETMSLVSIEDDSELNSLRMKTFTKSFRNYLPVIESPTAVDKCMEKNLRNMCHNSEMSPFERADYMNKIKEMSELHVCNGDYNSLECDQNSGTESADQNQYSDSEIEVPKGKPKIVKPGRDQSIDSNESADAEDNTPKGIRGRRKGLYVSPYKRNSSAPRKSPARTALTVKSTKGSITSKGTNGVVTKLQVSPKTPSNLTKISHVSAKSTVNSFNRNTSTTLKTKTTPPTKYKSPISNNEIASPKPTSPLVRQGTFTKEESSVMPLQSGSPKTPEKKVSPNSKLTKPGTILKAIVNTSPSRLPQPPTKVNSKLALKKTTSNDLTTAKASNGRTSNVTTKSSPSMKSSSSNQSLQSNDSGKTITLTSKPTKCSSSSSVHGQGSTSKPQTKDVTSKIANLWKKVEQSKKTSTKPDMRVWITNNESSSSTSQDSEEPIQLTPVDTPTKSKLIRSSTFEGSPKAVTSIPAPPKQKSSIAIRVSQTPNLKYASKVPVINCNGGIANPAHKRGKS